MPPKPRTILRCPSDLRHASQQVLAGVDSPSVCRYALNVFFNLQNKTIFNYFPYPWTVSAVHVVVGLLYCTASYFLGFRKASFGRVLAPLLPASCQLHPSLSLFPRYTCSQSRETCRACQRLLGPCMALRQRQHHIPHQSKQLT